MHLSSHETAVAPVYSQPELSRSSYQAFGKQDIHLFPSTPMYPGEAWRMNSYAGDQIKRYAAQLPNSGTNRFAGAFSTSRNLAASTQAPGFTSALSMNSGTTKKFASGSANLAGSFRSLARETGNNHKDSRPFSSGIVNKPFKPPTNRPPSNLPTVSTAETRLTQQNHAVILNPTTPNEPQTAAYTLPVGKDDDFSFLRGLAKDDMDDFAERKPVFPKRSQSRIASSPPVKRSKA